MLDDQIRLESQKITFRLPGSRDPSLVWINPPKNLQTGCTVSYYILTPHTPCWDTQLSILSIIEYHTPNTQLHTTTAASDLVNIVFVRFWSRRACVRHTWWRTKRSWPLFSPPFFFFFFFFLLFSSPPSTFHPLRGISRAWKFVSPNILA